MRRSCPGQDSRNLWAALYECPSCGTHVEIFSNEMRVKCHSCGTVVHRDKVPSCADWCASARECLGEEQWKRLKGLE